MTQIIQSTKIVNGVDLKTPPLIDPPPRAAIGEGPEKLNVVCVWWGDLYPVHYVENLRDMISRHLTVPYEMFCITDRLVTPEGITHMPCQSQEGWWQKINLFKPGLFEGRTLYFDLDVVITNSLDPIAKSEGDLVMIENFGPNKGHAAFNSSCMLWTPSEKIEKIYNSYEDSISTILHGDQCWIWRAFGNDILAFRKDLLDSYKYTKLGQWKRSSPDTAVWIFHGNPKPHQASESWVREHWTKNNS